MDSAFFQEGVGDYEQALQDYTNTMNREKVEEDALEKPVDQFNSTLQEVGDPIGAALLHKPLLKLVKKGLEKTLGKVAKTGQKVVGDAAERVAKGDVRGAARTLGKGAQDAINDTRAAVKQTASDLQGVAERTVTAGTEVSDKLAGQLGLRTSTPQAPAPATTESSTASIEQELPLRPEPDLLGESPPSFSTAGPAIEEAAGKTPQLDDLASRLGTTSDRLATSSTDEISSALNTDALTSGRPLLSSNAGAYKTSLADAQREGRGFLRGDSTIARATKAADPIADDAARPAQAAAGEGDQQAGGALRQAVQETQTGGAGGAEASTAADASLEAGGGAAADIATQTAAPIADGLTTAAEGASIAAGAEGGLNPFADVGAAILGLASILGVTFGGKHAVHESDPEFIPSAQFGI